jgi:hypothetical protein
MQQFARVQQDNIVIPALVSDAGLRLQRKSMGFQPTSHGSLWIQAME